MARHLFSIMICLLVFGLSVTSSAKEKKVKGLTLEQMVNTYSIDQIEQVANYMLARIEADPLPKGVKYLSCDPSIVKVNAWMSGIVHALGDEKRKREIEVYKTDPKSFHEKIRGCSDRCTCNAYQLLFEEIGVSMKGDAAHEKNLATMKKEMRKVNKEKSQACAKATNWFCGSPLHKFIERN